MRRMILIALLAAVAVLALPGVAVAGIGPSPFDAPGLNRGDWTAPGMIQAFAPQPEPPLWTPISQAKGEPPGTIASWTAPGMIQGFAPQPEPPLWTPISQVNEVPGTP